ncbi:MAG: general secretion pathway protein GspB [Candidatus Omnitrophota bacterium]
MKKTTVLFFGLVAFGGVFISNVYVFASAKATEQLRNPFLLLEEQKKGFAITAQSAEEMEAKIQEKLSTLHVSGIFISGSTKIAIINGEIVNEGDLVEGVRVSSIMPEKVIVDIQGEVGSLALPAVAENNTGE